MTDRCELTELLVDSCAHCLRHEESHPADGVAIHKMIDASMAGRCALDARHTISVGDRIGATDHGWVCQPCTARALRDAA